VNDPETGYSPFPGNINQLLFKLKPYVATLERTKGAMPEFVNPKYKDAEKSVFKKPTRLECMMQDFPTVLEDKESEKVGFTSIAADLCFSPVKNATADGVALQAKGSPPGVAASGEADQYGAVRAILRSVGCNIDDAPSATFSGITIVPGPQIVFKPNFVVCPAEYKKAFPMPEKVSISPKSSLVVNGTGVVIESLELDGALVIECEEGASGVIRDLSVVNEGWLLSPVESSNNEVIAMRGYVIEKRETRYITFKSDGSIEGDYDPDAAAKAREEAAAKAKAEAEEAAGRRGQGRRGQGRRGQGRRGQGRRGRS
jgi:UDP-sugar pyrophosphorylase